MLWTGQGHKDRVRTVHLTFTDHQEHIADDIVSVQTLDHDQDRPSNYQGRSVVKTNTCDSTYEVFFYIEHQFEEFDNAHDEEA